MQVFLTDPNPYTTAGRLFSTSPKATCVVIREGQQLLSVSALAYTMDPLTKLDDTPYSTKNHKAHPWAVWLREDYRNWHYLFHVVRDLVILKYGHADIRSRRLTDYANEHVSLYLTWVEAPEWVPFFPHRDLAGDPRLAGLTSYDAHRAYIRVKYPEG